MILSCQFLLINLKEGKFVKKKMDNESVLQRITVNPLVCGGRPCIRGMRIRVSDVLDLLANGLTPQEIIEELPDLTLEDIQACLVYVARRFEHPILQTA